jgi:DNA-binding Lrp family transcriptional regulator
MQTSKLARLEDQAIKILLENEEGILQSELWQRLGVSSRVGSRLAIKLEKKGYVRRERVLAKDRWTLKLIPLIKKFDPSPLFGAPCPLCPFNPNCGPDQSVSPIGCTLIEDWVIRSYREAHGKTTG